MKRSAIFDQLANESKHVVQWTAQAAFAQHHVTDLLPTVTHIFVASVRGASMKSVVCIDAVAGEGLLGDRYAQARNRRAPDYEVTFIEREHIEAFSRETGL